MKWLLFLSSIYLIFGSSPAFAQEMPKTITIENYNLDSNEISDFINDALKLRSSYPDSAFGLLAQALQLSKRANYKEGVIHSFLGMGICLMNTRAYAESKVYLDSAHLSAFVGSEPTNKQLFYIYTNFGALYSNRQDNAIAIRYYFLALGKMKSAALQDTSFLILLYNNIGATFMQLSQQDKALFYLEKGIELALKTEDSLQLGDLYLNMGMAHQEKLEYAKALNALSYAARLFERYHFRHSLQHAYYCIGRNYLFQNQLQDALDYFDRAVEVDAVAAKRNSRLLQGIAGAAFKLGDYEKSEKKYNEALRIGEQEGLREDRLTIYQYLAKIYTRQNRYRLAQQYQLAYSELSDSINTEKHLTAVNQLEVKYRVSEKDREIAQKQVLLLQQKSRLKRKNLWIAGISTGALLLSTLFISLYRIKRHKERLQQEHIRNLEKEQEIRSLKAKIKGEEEERVRVARELHDGVMVQFSAVKMNLSVLPKKYSMLKGADDFKKIVENLDYATGELRRTAHNLLPDVLLEGGLSEAVFYFCKELQQSTGLVIDFQQYVDLPRLQPEVELSVYRMVQELLQNVIKHAEASLVIIQLSYADDLLSITIEDNGKGFDRSDTSGKDGIGLRNIYARVTALKGQIEIQSNESGGTTIYLELDTRNSTLG